LEAFSYLLAEAVICAYAHHTDQTEKLWKKNLFLPWSEATSDDDVFNQKKAQLMDSNSKYYSRMPLAAADVIQQCGDKVRLEYEQVPNYASLGVVQKRISML